jgi:hypothetical protein
MAFMAPGNYVRLHTMLQSPSIIHLDLVHRIFPFSVYLFFYLSPIFLLLAVTVLIRFKKHPLRVLTNKNFSLFMILAFLSAYVLLGTPFTYFDPRVLFFTEVLLLTAFGSLLPEKYNLKGFMSFFPLILAILLACALAVDMIKTFLFYNKIDEQYTNRAIFIQKNGSDNTSITVPSFYGTNPTNDYHIHSGRLFVQDISVNPNYWTNQCVSSYYGLHSIRAENTDGTGAPATRLPEWALKLAPHIGIKITTVNHVEVNQ